jgi:hypothetical protein
MLSNGKELLGELYGRDHLTYEAIEDLDLTVVTEKGESVSAEELRGKIFRIVDRRWELSTLLRPFPTLLRTSLLSLRRGAGKHPPRRDLQGHHRHEDRPKHKDRAASKRDQGRGRDLRPAGHPYGDHLACILAGSNRPGMEHGPRG